MDRKMSVYAGGRPSRRGQRLKDGKCQPYFDAWRDLAFWMRVDMLVSAWCCLMFENDSQYRDRFTQK